MKPKNNPFHQFPAAAFATMILAMSSTAQASTTWDGGIAGPPATVETWGTAENWSDDLAPTFDNSANLSFPTSTVTNFNSALGNPRTIRSMTFGADVDSAFGVSYSSFASGTTQILTMGGGVDTPFITVDADATGAITLGNPYNLVTAQVGSLALAGNLAVTHNGSGILLFNRAVSGATFGITKTGTGTMQTNSFNSFTGAININQGTLIANTFGSAGQDLNAASAINLGGGTLEIGASTGTNKTYANVPVNVNSPSTLTYKNVNAVTFTAQFTDTVTPSPAVVPFVLNADLTVRNESTTTSVTNAFNIGRAITGTGGVGTRNLSVETYNNITAIGDNFSLGRVFLSGDNSGWSGNIVISKGTVSLGGTILSTNLNAAGTGDIIIGTAGDPFGAGLTFFPGANVTYNNDIIVNTGGFRAIKGGNNAFNVTFNGAVTLNKDLTVDHTWSATDKKITLNGPISGVGGLTITRSAGNSGTTAVLGGASDYSGPTIVTTGASLSLARTCSLASNITVQTGARIGGAGSTTGTLTLDAGANYFFFFSASYAPMNVSGTVTLANSFDINSGLVGGSQGEVIPWANVAPGTYTLIGGTASKFDTGDPNNNNIGNFGLANQVVDVGGVSGKNAYFQNGGGTSGGGLQLVVTGPSGYDAWKSTNLTGGGLDEDHDDDGVDNGTEYFLFGSASTTGFTALPGVINTAGVRSVTWPAASINAGYAGVYGIHFTVETSDTLEAGSWVTAPLGTGAGKVDIPFATAAQIRNVKYTFPTTGPKKFARLKVTGP